MRIPAVVLLLALVGATTGCDRTPESTAQRRRFVPRIRTDGDCIAICKRAGMCTAFEGRCIATKVSHCRNSEDCERRGRCKLAKPICVTADAGAAASASGQPAKR
jgi:hypothetical protein